MLKAIIFSLIFFTNLLYAKLNIVVSVLPELSFVKAIGKEMVSVSAMVKPGDSPHTYEPKPSQMRDISKADIYFSIGVEFEKVWLKRFANQNRKMVIIDISRGIKREPMATFGRIPSHAKAKDPHVWISPDNIKIIAKNIYMTLAKKDQNNKERYKINYQKFISHIDMVDKEIKEILKGLPKGTRFMVFHPAWGYFAKEYNLTQLPVEIEGKTPKPKSLIKILKIAKRQRVRAIFTQPEFSPKIADRIAKELHIKVIKVTPLNPDWEKNLINFAKAIAG